MHAKEHRLHCDVKRGDRVFYYTTTGWMMWDWLVTALAARSHAHALRRLAVPGPRERAVRFRGRGGHHALRRVGQVPRRDRQAAVRPAVTHKLDALRVLLSTGSPLSPEGFEYVYRDIKADVCLASISGGTDIVACFAGGCPILPVWARRDPAPPARHGGGGGGREGGARAWREGRAGLHKAVPHDAARFLERSRGLRYRRAYFERFANVWTHGDYCEITRHGGLVIHGRSDAVLNPGGVRIGTAEIYRQVEKLDEIEEWLVIGQDWPPAHPRDVRVVLFVRLREGVELDEALVKKVRETIRANTTSRHVPAKIVAVPDIPRTKSNKIVELAVRAVVHGEPVRNLEALANPEALEHFKGLPELAARHALRLRIALVVIALAGLPVRGDLVYGQRALQRGDPENAYKEFKAAAEAGDAEAARRLGLMLGRGIEFKGGGKIEARPAEAAHWYRVGADMGDVVCADVPWRYWPSGAACRGIRTRRCGASGRLVVTSMGGLRRWLPIPSPIAPRSWRGSSPWAR